MVKKDICYTFLNGVDFKLHAILMQSPIYNLQLYIKRSKQAQMFQSE